MWTDPSSFRGKCFADKVAHCVKYDTFHGECISCEVGFEVQSYADGSLATLCSDENHTKIIMAVLVILLAILTCIVVTKYRESREVDPGYHESLAVYATPLRATTPNDNNLRDQGKV